MVSCAEFDVDVNVDVDIDVDVDVVVDVNNDVIGNESRVVITLVMLSLEALSVVVNK